MRTTTLALRLLCFCIVLILQSACHTGSSSTAGQNNVGNSNDVSPQTPGEAEITAAGGSLQSPEHDANLMIPPNALAANTLLAVTVQAPSTVAAAGLTLASEVFHFSPSDTTFKSPASLTAYVSTAANSPNIVLAALADNGLWQPLPGSVYSPAAGTVTASISHLGVFAAVVVPNGGLGCNAFADPNAWCAPAACNTFSNTCISTLSLQLAGTISGLVPNTGITISNGTSSRAVFYPDTSFQFAQLFPAGTSYSLSINGNSPGMVCTLANANGTLGAADTAAPAVTCTLHRNFGNNPNAAFVIGQDDATSNSDAFDDRHISQPYAAFGAANGYVYVTDGNNFRVLSYASIPANDGEAAVAVLGQPDLNSRITWYPPAATTANQIQACGIAADDNYLLVTDCFIHRALLFAPLPDQSNPDALVVLGQPNYLTSTGSCGASGLYEPAAPLLFNGRIIIMDAGNNRVLIWNSIPQNDGAPADMVLGQGDFNTCSAAATSLSSMREPTQAWTDGMRLLVADGLNNRVLVWNTFPTMNGQAADGVIGQASTNGNATGNPQLNPATPTGVVVDGNTIYISEYGAGRISIWEGFPDGQNTSTMTGVIGQADTVTVGCNRGAGPGSPAGNTLCQPVALQLLGNLLIVADYGDNRVVAYESR